MCKNQTGPRRNFCSPEVVVYHKTNRSRFSIKVPRHELEEREIRVLPKWKYIKKINNFKCADRPAVSKSDSVCKHVRYELCVCGRCIAELCSVDFTRDTLSLSSAVRRKFHWATFPTTVTVANVNRFNLKKSHEFNTIQLRYCSVT